MFNIVGRNSFKITSIHRLFSRSSCSSPAASDNPFAVSYLVDSWGFSPEKAISASKYFRIKTPDRADSVVAFLKNQGFTETQISQMVRKSPMALNYNPETNILPKFEFLRSIGLTDSDIVKLSTARPSFLGGSLKNRIEPNFNVLRDLFQSKDKILAAIRRCPMVLDGDLQANMVPNMQILRDVGVPASKMLYILTWYPGDFLVSTDQFKKIVEEVMEMGIDPTKPNFMVAVHALRAMSKSIWDKKMETYQKWGWSKSQILVAFRANPWCMVNSEEKIEKVMEFLVNKMGFETSYIAKNSLIISFSLEKRIIPRCLVYKYCLDKGLREDKNHFGFIRWLSCPDNIFVKKLEKYETKTPGVLKIYQEKMDHAD